MFAGEPTLPDYMLTYPDKTAGLDKKDWTHMPWRAPGSQTKPCIIIIEAGGMHKSDYQIINCTFNYILYSLYVNITCSSFVTDNLTLGE